jgi:hypothetical protein
MTKHTNRLLERVASWPEEDQEELVELAQEIEARRSGVYVLNADEQGSIAKARQSPLASEEKVAAFWKRVTAV